MNQSEYREWNFDGLVGPSHNYAGLSFGNLASQKHQSVISNPKKAALQGLAKMRTLMQKGIPQAFLIPHERPYFSFCRHLGLKGNLASNMDYLKKHDPSLLHNLYSAAAMWTANCATCSPSTDTQDKKLHLSVANLNQNLHRSLEANFSYRLLKSIFHNDHYFHVHQALSPGFHFSDEGAANHMRLCHEHSQEALEVFVFGHYAYQKKAPAPKYFPSRQSYEASFYLAKRHGLKQEHTLFIQQDPNAIDAGVFHNDVIALANENVLLFHEKAFLNQAVCIENLVATCETILGFSPYLYCVSEEELSVKEAVMTYLFNSQLITLSPGHMLLVCPKECEESPKVMKVIERLLNKKGPLKEVCFLNLRESMQNGGGPACLRLRVLLSHQEEKAINNYAKVDKEKLELLEKWVHHHYRDKVSSEDLKDPLFAQECLEALDALTQVLNLGTFYDFQK